MAAIGILLRLLALLVMYLISNPKIVDLMPPLKKGYNLDPISIGTKQIEVQKQ